MNSTDWTQIKLSELISGIDAGVSVNAENRIKENGELGVLKTSSVVYGIFDPVEHKAVKDEERHRVTVYPKSDRILICRSNTVELVGICAYVNKDYDDLFLPDTLWQITIEKSLCSAKWLTYALNSEVMRKKIQSIATGTSGSMKKISMSNFLKLDIVLPPLKEQEIMAEIFGLCDDAIRLTNEKTKAKKKLKRELLHRILSGEYRFSEHPLKSWKKVKLRDFLRSREELGEETSELDLYSLTIENGITPKTNRYNRKFLVRHQNKQYKKVYPKDIVYNPPNLRYGAIAISNIDEPVLVSPSYEILYIENTDEFDSDFIYYVITTEDQIKRFGQRAEGTLVERMAVKLDSFLEFDINIPASKEEQQSIVFFLKAMDAEIDLLSQKVDKFEQLRVGFAQNLLTGQVRVQV